MDNRVALINLYDCYQTLLTDKQQAYFEDYYFNNLSFQEIGELYDVSRNAIFKSLKDVEELLNSYEEKLMINKKNLRIKELIKEIDVKIKEEIENLL